MDRELLFCILALERHCLSAEAVVRLLVRTMSGKGEGLASNAQNAGLLSQETCLDLSEQVELHTRRAAGNAMAAFEAAGGGQRLADLLLGGVGEDAWGQTLSAAAEYSGEELGSDITEETPGRYAAGRTEDGSQELGRGGIGRVLVAYDTHLGREIAIKELLDEAARLEPRTGFSSSNPSMANLARFLREARVTGQLEHPNIVPVYELGRRSDGKLYYTMKLVRGQTLHQALCACKTPAERLRLLPHYVDVCQAIAYAHSRGVIHRDIKPHNIMLGEFGETVVLDWGLAKVHGRRDLRGGEIEKDVRVFRGNDESGTLVGCAVGTPAYMSPEQARGDIESVDERSDVFSLGALLYEMITGGPPFGAGTPARLLERVITDTPRPPEEVVPEVSRDLASVCMKALKKDPEDRYSSAKALALEIEAYQSGRQVDAYQYSSWELFKRLILKNKAASVVLASALLLLSVGTVTLYNSLRREETSRIAETRHRRLAEEQRERADQLRDQAVQESERAVANQRIADWNLSLALQEESNRRVQTASQLEAELYAAHSLEHVPPEEVSDSVPGAEGSVERRAALRTNVYLSRVLSPIVLEQSHLVSGGLLGGMVVGTKEAFLTVSQESIQESSWDGKTPPRTVLLTQPAMRAAISLDGKRIALVDDRGVTSLLEWPSGREIMRWNEAPGIVGLLLGTTGERVFGASKRGALYCFDPGDSEPRKIWNPGKVPQALTYSEPAGILAVGGVDLPLTLMDTKGENLRELDMQEKSIFAAAISPDGKHVLGVSYDGSMALWNLDTGTMDWKTTVSLGHVVEASFIDGGSGFVLADHTGRLGIWRTEGPQLLATHLAHSGRIQNMRFLAGDGSRPGRLVTAGADGLVRSWSLKSPDVERIRTGLKSVVYRLALSADASRLAVAALEGPVQVYELPGGRFLGQHSDSPQFAWSLTFGSQSKWVLSAGYGGEILMWNPAEPHARKLVQLSGSGVGAFLTREGGVWAVGSHRIVKFEPESVSNALNLSLEEYQKRFAATSGLAQDRVLDFPDDEIWSVDLSPDESSLAVGFVSGTIVMLSTKDLSETSRTTAHGDWVTWLAFSPTGGRLASSCRNASVKLWSVPEMEFLRELRGHDLWVNQVRWSRDETHVATGSDDETTRLWDVESGSVCRLFSGHGEVTALQFHPVDGALVLANGSDVVFYPPMTELDETTGWQLIQDSEIRSGLKLEGFSAVPR